MEKSLSNNPLLNYEIIPDFNQVTEADCTEAFTTVLDELSATVAQIATAPPAATAAEAWEEAYLPIIAALEAVEQVWKQVEYMHSVNNTPFWNKMFNQNIAKTMAALDGVFHNQEIYKKLTELAQGNLSDKNQASLDKFLKKFELLGAGLTPAAKEIFSKIRQRISELQSRFDDNLMAAAADPRTHVIIADEALLGEMPDYIKAIYARDGGWHFSPTESSYQDFMKYCQSRAKREKMYYSYHSLCSPEGPAQYDNMPIITEVVTLRQEQAKMLNYPNYKELALQTRMEKDSGAVEKFLNNILAGCRPKAQRELKALEKFARATGKVEKLEPWDVPFFSRKRKEEELEYSEAALRDYLNAEQVLSGLFGCAENLFDIKFTPADLPKWHPEIEYFQVEDKQTRRPLGYVRLDPYYRNNKFDTAWMSQTTPRSTAGGTEQLPVINVSCNFPARQSGQPSQLNIRDVWVLFHEFGHAIHNLTSLETDYNLNVEKTEADFVEMPSQFMENFMWDWGVMSSLSSHVATGEQMPRALFDKAKTLQNIDSGQFMLRYLEKAFFDLEAHSGGVTDFAALHHAQKAKTEILKTPDYNMNNSCHFIHLFRNEESDIYAAGYYIYMWAQMYSSDAYALFKKSGKIINPELGKKLRTEVFEQSSAQDSALAYQRFAGRAPNYKHILAHYEFNEPGVAQGRENN